MRSQPILGRQPGVITDLHIRGIQADLTQNLQGRAGGIAKRRRLHTTGYRGFTRDGFCHDIIGMLDHQFQALAQNRRLQGGHRWQRRSIVIDSDVAGTDPVCQCLGHIQRRCGRTRHVPAGSADPPAVEHRRFHRRDIALGNIPRIPTFSLRRPRPQAGIDLHRIRMPDRSSRRIQRRIIEPHVPRSADNDVRAIMLNHRVQALI